MARGRPSKKQLILDTARRLFAKTGYQGTSIDLVVKEAGISKPTIYNNFKTKQALLLALMEELLREAEAFQKKLWQRGDLSPAEGIITVFENTANTPALLAIYRISYGESHKLDETTYQLLKQFDTTMVEGCKQWLIDQKLTLTESQFLMVIAICREGILIPALSNTTPPDKALVSEAVHAQLKK